MTEPKLPRQSGIPRKGIGLFYRFLIAAVILHILVTVSIYFVGRTQLLPDLFDSQGYGSFALDGTATYLFEIKSFIDVYDSGGLFVWLQEPFTFFVHAKLVSFSFILLRPLFGFTILGAELYNLVFYMVILCLIYALGKEVFNQQTGLLATMVIGVWPSFLLHTTQLLKDSFFIAGFLALMLINTRWFMRKHRPAITLVYAVLAIFFVRILGLIRPAWPLMLVTITVLSVLGLIIQALIERRIMLWNLIGATVVLGATVLLSRPNISSLTAAQRESPPSITDQTKFYLDDDNRNTFGIWGNIEAASRKIGSMRWGFICDYPGAGSVVDANYQINSTKELFWYLPRAIAVGLLSPFPSMWLVEGEFLGLSARLLSGVETSMMYLIDLLAVIGTWQARRKIPVWYLVIVIFLGVMFLGLVVPVIGALYRMRYVYWMLLVLLGAVGLQGVVRPLIHKLSKIVAIGT